MKLKLYESICDAVTYFFVFTMMLFYFMIRFWDSNCKKINQTKIMDVIQD